MYSSVDFPYRCTLWSVLLNCVLFRRERSFCCLLTVSGGLGLLVLSSNPCSHQEAMIQTRRTQEATAFEVTENLGVASTCTITIVTLLPISIINAKSSTETKETRKTKQRANKKKLRRKKQPVKQANRRKPNQYKTTENKQNARKQNETKQ